MTTLSKKAHTCCAAILMLAALRAYSSNTCDQQKVHFKRIIQPLLITQSEGKWIPAQSTDPAITEYAHQFLSQIIIQGLNSGLNATELANQIACVQDFEQYQMFRAETNVPRGFSLDASHAVVAYLVFRGGIAVPDVRPFVDLFLRTNGKWSQYASAGDYFVASTFYLHEVSNSTRDSRWFLLTGRPIGGTGGLLRIQLLTVAKDRMDVLWSKELTRSDLVRVDHDYVEIKSEDLRPSQPYREFVYTYRITGSGLKYESRRLVYKVPAKQPDTY